MGDSEPQYQAILLSAFQQWPQLITLAWLPVIASAAYGVYFIFLRKMDYNVGADDRGYIQFDGLNKRQAANRVRMARRTGKLPPVVPNGWYMVMESGSLPSGTAQSVTMLGLTLAVFRDNYNTVHILDAHCPHFGANLAAGGRVKGDCLECPFHGWEFRGSDGKCVKIPTLPEGGKIPEQAKVRSHTVKEVNNGIYIWFDAEDRQPYWDLPILEEIAAGEWSQKGRTRHFVSCHIEEINQNGADIAHLTTVHHPGFMSGIDLRYIFRKITSFMWFSFNAKWAPGSEEGDKHRAVMNMDVGTVLLGWKIPFMSISVEANQLGPGIVYLKFDSVFGRGAFIHCVTPVEPLLLRVYHSVYLPWYIPNIIGTIYLSSEAFQFERDMMIWNNKEYKAKPVLCRTELDSFMLKHRRWYSQFYSENSPTIDTMMKEDTDW